MNPPYDITPLILDQIASISKKLGAIEMSHLVRPETQLRKKNRIRTIQSSLEIEGNTMTENQITALLNNERVLAPEKDILEVQNAIEVYDKLSAYDYHKLSDFKKAHQLLMKGLVQYAGQFRKSNVGVVKGSEVTHMAPPGHLVHGQMKNLFTYLKTKNENVFIKSCVFHYELEFIHPFVDGNGRMGRLWQTLILMSEYPVFEFLPVEHLIKQHQSAYYGALGESDKSGKSTPFIEFMLTMIDQALEIRLQHRPENLTAVKRLQLFREHTGSAPFGRKAYLQVFKEISTATASRDLLLGVEQGILKKEGDKRNTTYCYKNSVW